MLWRDDGDGCWALLNPQGVVIAAYGPDPSKPGWFRGFAFNPETSQGSHESMWESEADVKRDIELWFDADGKMRPHTERSADYKKLMEG